MNEYRIVFLGICAFVQMAVGGHDAMRLIMPNLAHASAPIGRHVPFVALPLDGYDGNQGWGVPNHFEYEQTKYVYFLLDGDEISFGEKAEKLDVKPGFDNVPQLQKKLCPSFQAIHDDYIFGIDHGKKVAQIDIAHGALRARSMFAGMIGGELTIKTAASLEVTARSWKTGATRFIRVKPKTEVWIGNMSEAFFDPAAPHDPNANHFLAYYAMAKPPVTCTAVPGNPAPPQPAHSSHPQ